MINNINLILSATTEIRRADGQTVASFPGRSPITYNPALNPDYIDPQYSAAILSHIKNQQFNPNQGLIQYPNGIPPTTPFPLQDYPINPTGPLPYDAPMNGNIFSNFFNQFPSNLIPSNIYNNLHSTFPNIIPQQNPLNTFATNIQNGIQQFTQNNPLGNFVSNAQTQFQQNNPFANWFNGNRFGQQQQQQQQILQSPQLFLQSQQQQSLPGVGFSGLTGLGASNYLQNHRIPTTKRRRIIGTTKRRKHGLKTRDDTDADDWLEEFLESRKREMIYGLTTTTATPKTVLNEVDVGGNKVPA